LTGLTGLRLIEGEQAIDDSTSSCVDRVSL
jgi:hypothetical protein